MINKVLGPTFPPVVTSNLAVLSYEGISFIFKYAEDLKEGPQRDLMLIAVDNYLAKITMGDTDQKHSLYGTHRKVRILLNQGIEISNDTQVLFGDHKMDALRILGNPNKEYYKEDKLILNYLEQGFDVVIDNGGRVSKFIMHTNFHYHPQFTFYNRCFYEMDLHEFVGASSAERSREESKGQKKKRKKQEKQMAAKISEDPAIVTPLTKFSHIKSILDKRIQDGKPQHFVRNVTEEFITHYHAYPGIIFEVMTESDLVASVTLFQQ